jgi:uncharacterized protein (DUF849 family)
LVIFTKNPENPLESQFFQCIRGGQIQQVFPTTPKKIQKFSRILKIQKKILKILEIPLTILTAKLDVKNVSRIRKKTFYLQFCMGTPQGQQKSIFNTPKVKKNKDT